MYADSVVPFLDWYLKSDLWFPQRVLNGGAVRPTYFSVFPSSDLTVAWYITFLALQFWLSRGHSDGSWQLQFSGAASVLGVVLLSNFELCLAMRDFTFGRHLYEIFTFLLFIRACRGDPVGKCLSMSFRNFAPKFVFTFIEYGGLNHIILRFLCFLGFPSQGGSNFSVCVYPFLFNSAWYRGAAVSNISLFDDIADSLLFTAIGMFLRIEGG